MSTATHVLPPSDDDRKAARLAEQQARVLAEVERLKATGAFAGPALPPRPPRCRVGASPRDSYVYPIQRGLAL